jgi:hypothetical protein
MDPETGRFISREPLEVMPGWGGNPYGYGDANVVNATDPLGLFPGPLDGCMFGVGPFCDDDDWGDGCYGQPLTSAPCLGPEPEPVEVNLKKDIRLIGEYLVISGVGRWRTGSQTESIINIESNKPAEDALTLFEAIRKSSGSPVVQAESKNGAVRLFFKTKDGVTVTFRRGKVGDTPTVDFSYKDVKGSIKIKFFRP